VRAVSCTCGEAGWILEEVADLDSLAKLMLRLEMRYFGRYELQAAIGGRGNRDCDGVVESGLFALYSAVSRSSQ
jgi:hypothetical protein